GHGLDAAGAAGVGDVDRVLEEDDRVVVGERDAPAAESLGFFRDLLRAGPVGERVHLARLRHVPVLAEAAAEVAAGGAEAEDRRPRKEVVERFLLHRVDAEPARSAVGGEDDAVVLPRADEAEAALALVESAVARAEIALDPPVLQRVPVSTL